MSDRTSPSPPRVLDSNLVVWTARALSSCFRLSSFRSIFSSSLDQLGQYDQAATSPNSRAFLWVEVLGGDLRLSRHSCSGSFPSLLLAMRPQASEQPPNGGRRTKKATLDTDGSFLPSMAEWLKYTHRFPGLEAGRRKQWAAWEGLGQEPVREMFSIAWRRRVLGKMNASCTLHGLVLRSFCTPHAHTFNFLSVCVSLDPRRPCDQSLSAWLARAQLAKSTQETEVHSCPLRFEANRVLQRPAVRMARQS